MEIGETEKYDYYDILNVSQDATMEQIAQSYKNLSRTHHPDKCNGSAATFIKLKKAFDTLSDATMRQFYDKYGVEGVHVAGMVDRDEEQDLALPEDKLASLEKNVRHLLRMHEELKEQRTAQLSGESSIALQLFIPRWHKDAIALANKKLAEQGEEGRTFDPNGRIKYCQTSQNVAFNSWLGKITLGTVSHIQTSAKDVSRGIMKYICVWHRQWNESTITKVSASLPGTVDATVNYRISKKVSISNKINFTPFQLLAPNSYFTGFNFDFGENISTQIGGTLTPDGFQTTAILTRNKDPYMSSLRITSSERDTTVHPTNGR